VDLEGLARHLLDRWPTAEEEDELETAGGEIAAEPFGDVRCSFLADENGDTYALAVAPLPGHWTNEGLERELRLRFYGGDLLPDPR
jgi:hypothetical protein